jgi:hypothetical protein
MAEGGKFYLSMFEWTTPERLFVKLKGIFGDEELALKELSSAYRTNVRSARVPRGDFGFPAWDEAQINAPEFRQTHPLRMFPDGFSIENEWPHRRRWWGVYFSAADANARWPSLRPAAAPEIAPAKTRDRPGRPPIETPKTVQKMRDEIERGDMTPEGLRTLRGNELLKRFGTLVGEKPNKRVVPGITTIRNAKAFVLEECAQKLKK